ncbi:unnamed protein product, partial [Meganyctiphanes norvegica]
NEGSESNVDEQDGVDSRNEGFPGCQRSKCCSNDLKPDILPSQNAIAGPKGQPKVVELVIQPLLRGYGGGKSSFSSKYGDQNMMSMGRKPTNTNLSKHQTNTNPRETITTRKKDGVGNKIEEQIVCGMENFASEIKSTFVEAFVRLPSPRLPLSILHYCVLAENTFFLFLIAFWVVASLGGGARILKITFWLIENNCRVLIAACDTFRAGAVEQLRTHKNHLNSLHPPEKHSGRTMVELFEQGYGKDAADIAKHAVDYARKNQFDVVLIDTAGRMQDNEPLMRALAKLIIVNEPDLCLFVGEALVGNEAVDQLVKFNRALANHSNSQKPQMIDGIVLTKFDTIDDKVGAAISMTYITGQPIVFVGCGQTYTDLRKLDAKAVVNSLMKI